jgi:Fe-S-cluster containining protein
MSLPLSRPYPCRDGAPVIDRVDPRVFELTYFARCMDCSFCHDACCRYGADIEITRVREIERHRADLEAYLGVPRADWFREDPEDIGMLPEPDYAGGAYTRTGVVDLPVGRSPHGETGCVFLDTGGRGCRLHRFALDRGIDVHTIKPIICVLFPLSFEGGELTPACEFDLDDLVCRGPGATVYQSARADLLHYFGPDLVAELDRLDRQRALDAGRVVPLPVSS